MRVAIYLRCSTNHQVHSLETQEHSIRHFLSNKTTTCIEVFKDYGYSGSKDNRPDFDRMLALCKLGNYDCVAVHSFSRFSRNLKTLINAMDEFSKSNITFVSVSENLDSSTIVGKLIFNIISSLSQFEREQISFRVKEGLKRAKSQGKHLGRKKTRNSELISNLLAQGISYRKIAAIAKCSLATIANEARSKKTNIQNTKQDLYPFR